MTDTVPAAAIGLPNQRRAFLRQLCTLPLIGGGVSLIGQPTAVAEPVTLDLMQSYKTWLFYEHRSLAWEMANHPEYVAYYGSTQSERFDRTEGIVKLIEVGGAARYHRYDGSAPPSGRAALVLSAVGCDWREPEL